MIFIGLMNIVATTSASLAVTEFFQKHRTESLVISVILVSVLVLELLDSIYCGIRSSFMDRVEARRFLHRIKALSPSDKYVLSLFVEERKLTRELDPTEPSVAWLESIKLLYRSEGSADGAKTPFRISIYAMDYLSKNPNLLR